MRITICLLSRNIIMKDKILAILTEKRFFEWYCDEVSVTLRNRGGSYGNGSEVLVVVEQYAEATTKE